MSEVTDFEMDDFDDVSALESEAKFRIITLEDEDDNPQSKQIIHDLNVKVNRLYSDFRIWLNDCKENDTVQEKKEQLKEESERLFTNAKTQLTKLKENEDLKQVVDKGIQVAADAGNWIVDTISVGVKEVMKQEPVQKFNDAVNEKITQFKDDERVKESVSSFKRSTLKLAENAFEGLKKVLEEEKSSESETEVFDDEKNNNL